MNLTKEEKLAIVYSCWALAHNNGFMSRAEHITLEVIGKAIGFKEEYTEEVKALGIKKTIAILKNLKQEKKNLVIKYWGMMIGYNGNTDWKSIESTTKRIDSGEETEIDKEQFAGFVSLYSQMTLGW